MSGNLIFEIPVVFDMSGDLTLFGELPAEDLVDHHLVWRCSTTDVSASRLENLFLIGDLSGGSSLFWARADNSGNETNQEYYVSNFSEFISRILLKDSNLIFNNSDISKNVPIGPAVLGQDPSQNIYTSSLTGLTGTKYAECMIRVLCTHLLGNPLSQTFIKDETNLINYIESDANVYLLASQINETLGGDVSGNGLIALSTQKLNGVETSIDASQNVNDGVSNTILKTMYEQMFSDISNNATRRQRMVEMSDLSGDQQNIKTFVYKLPFLPGDKINFYIRNYINLDFEALTDASGNVTNTLNDLELSDIFPGGSLSLGVPSPGCYGWMGNAANNSFNITQQTTDVSGNRNVFDAHIWKIQVTLV
tara:strand:- start:5257 stop:6351 length:1095 start_codon:yes stop_codon:yes gene_type:complete